MATNRAQALQVVDPLLSNIARRYTPSGYIQDRLLSDSPVTTFTGKYVVFTDQYWFMNETETLTEDRAESREIDYEWSTDSFSCEKHALKISYTDEEIAQAVSVLDVRREKTEFLAHRFLHAREIRIAKLLSDTSNGGLLNLSSTPSVNWDQDTATIEADIKTGVLAVYDKIGIVPNTLVIPFKVAYAMALQADIRELFKYTVNGQETLRVGDRVLPSVIHGMDVVIPKGAQKDTANEGGTSARSEIWGADVRLLYVDKSAGRYKPSVLKRFVHTQPTTVRWEVNDPDVTYVRVHERIDEKVVAPDAGYVLNAVL
jgi:hypothetical protein